MFQHSSISRTEIFLRHSLLLRGPAGLDVDVSVVVCGAVHQYTYVERQTRAIFALDGLHSRHRVVVVLNLYKDDCSPCPHCCEQTVDVVDGSVCDVYHWDIHYCERLMSLWVLRVSIGLRLGRLQSHSDGTIDIIRYGAVLHRLSRWTERTTSKYASLLFFRLNYWFAAFPLAFLPADHSPPGLICSRVIRYLGKPSRMGSPDIR